MAWADVPMGTKFSQEDIEARGWDSFPHMQEAKAAFDRRMRNKRPLAEPTASLRLERMLQRRARLSRVRQSRARTSCRW